MLDPALTRPGRLSRRVVVPLPDERGRADILAVHLRVVPLAPELNRASACAALAKITGGFSGAELANVVNEAALLAGRKEAEVSSSSIKILLVLAETSQCMGIHQWTSASVPCRSLNPLALVGKRGTLEGWRDQCEDS